MEYFSDNYLYLLKAAYSADFFKALFYSIPAIFLLLVIAFCVLLTIGALVTGGPVLGGALLLIFGLLGGLFCSLSLSTVMPDMADIELGKQYFSKIYEEEYKKEVNNFKNEPKLALFLLQYGAKNIELSFLEGVSGEYHLESKETKTYRNFKTDLLARVPKDKIVLQEDIEKVFNTEFFKCMDQKDIPVLSENKFTIKQVRDLITAKENQCVNISSSIILENNNIIKRLGRNQE